MDAKDILSQYNEAQALFRQIYGEVTQNQSSLIADDFDFQTFMPALHSVTLSNDGKFNISQIQHMLKSIKRMEDFISNNNRIDFKREDYIVLCKLLDDLQSNLSDLSGFKTPNLQFEGFALGADEPKKERKLVKMKYNSSVPFNKKRTALNGFNAAKDGVNIALKGKSLYNNIDRILTDTLNLIDEETVDNNTLGVGFLASTGTGILIELYNLKPRLMGLERLLQAEIDDNNEKAQEVIKLVRYLINIGHTFMAIFEKIENIAKLPFNLPLKEILPIIGLMSNICGLALTIMDLVTIIHEMDKYGAVKSQLQALEDNYPELLSCERDVYFLDKYLENLDKKYFEKLIGLFKNIFDTSAKVCLIVGNVNPLISVTGPVAIGGTILSLLGSISQLGLSLQRRIKNDENIIRYNQWKMENKFQTQKQKIIGRYADILSCHIRNPNYFIETKQWDVLNLIYQMRSMTTADVVIELLSNSTENSGSNNIIRILNQLAEQQCLGINDDYPLVDIIIDGLNRFDFKNKEEIIDFIVDIDFSNGIQKMIDEDVSGLIELLSAPQTVACLLEADIEDHDNMDVTLHSPINSLVTKGFNKLESASRAVQSFFNQNKREKYIPLKTCLELETRKPHGENDPLNEATKLLNGTNFRLYR